jgi:hypothetical protein
MSDARKPSGPPMRTFDYSSHVGPNEKGLHDSAVIAQHLPKQEAVPAPASTTTLPVTRPEAPSTTYHETPHSEG